VKVVLTLLVRDEEDVLAANLDHHLALGVDRIVVTDNLSLDGTPAILEDYRRRGRVIVLRETRDDYAQGAWVTRMARLAARELAADWVLNGDADEFWWPRDGDLRTTLASVPPAWGVVVAPRHNLVPDPRVATGPFHRRCVLRETVSRNHLGQPLPPKVCHRGDPDVVVAQGNHAVSGPRLGPVLEDRRLEILHVPLRTFDHFQNKIVKGGRAYDRNTELPRDAGHVWRTLYRAHEAGELRAAWDALVPDRDAVARGLAAGTLAEDHRLRRAVDALAAGTRAAG
jgi:hypothetical protein